MNRGRWLDHLPPWLAWGAIAATGVYTPRELALMAAPLLWAVLAEARGWGLLRWRLLVELVALAGFLAQVVAHTGLLPTVVNTLFLLCGARLCLPRALPQRRQLLLMGFLLFLTTAISTTDLDFLLWSVAWVACTAAVLLQQTWGQHGQRRHGHPQPPPFRLVLPWTVLVVVLASGFFVILPRLRVGIRARGGGDRPGVGTAGLSDVLDLSGTGPIQPNGEVVLRVLPTGGPNPAFPRQAGLLRCLALEELDGRRWSISPLTPPRNTVRWNRGSVRFRPLAAECYVAPSPTGIIPLPYGEGELETVGGLDLRNGRGAGVRFTMPVRQTTTIRLALTPSPLEREPAPLATRRALLTATGTDSPGALAWSLREVPGDPPPEQLADRLTARLRTFRYTLDNPSGGAANPTEDFLLRTRAGHCEYFASALALMLRQRGIPSRVVNGYRLGPWLEGGGYFLVTQSEAHSWVEYYDASAGGWRSADPTPAAPPSALGAPGLSATLARWSDAVRFQWDRHVVLFSDQDQVAGLDWLQARMRAMSGWRPRMPGRGPVLAGAGVVLAGMLLLRFRKRLGLRWVRRTAGPGALRELRPLIRRVGDTCPPLPGETAKAWLLRLALARPARKAALEALGREADAMAYGGKDPGTVGRLAREEVRAWTRPDKH